TVAVDASTEALLRQIGPGMGNINNAAKSASDIQDASKIGSGLNVGTAPNNSPFPSWGDFLDFGTAISDYLDAITLLDEWPTYEGVRTAILDYLAGLWPVTKVTQEELL